jgi:hypothetical protein
VGIQNIITAVEAYAGREIADVEGFLVEVENKIKELAETAWVSVVHLEEKIQVRVGLTDGSAHEINVAKTTAEGAAAPVLSATATSTVVILATATPAATETTPAAEATPAPAAATTTAA